MFTKRNTSLAKAIKLLQMSEADLLRQQNEEEKKLTLQIIPTTQHILDNYHLLSIGEKNQRWKKVMKKAAVYHTQDDELIIHIYPNLPQ